MNRSFWFAVFVTGFSSILTQILVLREAYSGFYGNELVMGVFLGNWLLLTGVGAYLGGKSNFFSQKYGVFSIIQVGIAVLAPLTIFFAGVLRVFVTTPGEIVGLIPVFCYSTIILAPFCILSGVRFPLASSLIEDEGVEQTLNVSKVYYLEYLGSLVGGFLFSLIFVSLFDSFQAVFIVTSASLFSAYLLAKISKKKFLKHSILLVAVGFTIFFSIIDLDFVSTEIAFPGQTILFSTHSPYGKIVLTETFGQLNFYENNLPYFSTESIQQSEEKIHYAMLSHDNPSDILLISGGVSGTLKEISKYSPRKIDYVELDPEILDVGEKYTTNLDYGGVTIFRADARWFVKNTENKYDVIIIDVPDPSSIQLNRFYTTEFFKELNSILNPYGVVSLSLSGGENYMSPESIELNSVVYTTLTENFENVIVIPGSTHYFLASSKPLSYDFEERINERQIKTRYFENLLPGTVSEDRVKYLTENLRLESKTNTDLFQTSHLQYNKYWLSVFKIKSEQILLLLSLIFLLALYALRSSPIPVSIFITGFTVISLEIILLLVFQVLYGILYQWVGLLVTSFMLGGVLGAFLGSSQLQNRKITVRLLSKLDFILFAFCISLPLILKYLLDNPNILMIPILTLVAGFISGLEFQVALKTLINKTGKALYTSSILSTVDLVGACFGAMLLSLFLIPLYGVVSVLVFLGFLNLASSVYIWFKE
ncbi:MAG: fused MFS/spermidine synthase [Methanobacteriota archaeon]